MLRPTVSRSVCPGIMHSSGAYDSTSCHRLLKSFYCKSVYMLQRDRVYLSVTMFCDVFNYPLLCSVMYLTIRYYVL
jgi:hypothetical protein